MFLWHGHLHRTVVGVSPVIACIKRMFSFFVSLVPCTKMCAKWCRFSSAIYDSRNVSAWCIWVSSSCSRYGSTCVLASS